jgi:hypothetical protein
MLKSDVLGQNTGVTGGRKKGGRVQEKGRSAIEEEEKDCIGIDNFRCRRFPVEQ